MEYEEQLEKEGIIEYMKRYLRKCINPNFNGKYVFDYYKSGGYYPFSRACEWVNIVVLTPYKTKFLKRTKIKRVVAVTIDFYYFDNIEITLHDESLTEYMLYLRKLINKHFRSVDEDTSTNRPYYSIKLGEGFPKRRRPMICPKEYKALRKKYHQE